MAIIGNGKRYLETKFSLEKEFEDDVVSSSKMLFGKSTVYINAKRKIESKSLGGAVPDGFFFDFSDPTDPQFYIVEIELSQHRFFEHIFPQITKFFAFSRTRRNRRRWWINFFRSSITMMRSEKNSRNISARLRFTNS